MPVFLVILALPFMVFVWIVRYIMAANARRTAEEMQAAIERAQFEARCARPFRDYVASLKPKENAPVPLRTTTVASSPPTLGNIGRFAALTVCGSRDEYFVRDEAGDVFGPADEATMHQWIHEGRISGETFISSHHDGPWLPAGRIRALQSAFHEAEPSSISSSRFDHLKIK
jgi:hypothetical protein